MAKEIVRLEIPQIKNVVYHPVPSQYSPMFRPDICSTRFQVVRLDENRRLHSKEWLTDYFQRHQATLSRPQAFQKHI